MYHMVTVCGVCDLEIVGPDYDNRHWSEDGVSEFHQWCCPECDHDDAELREAVADWYGWDRIAEEILNKEDK